MENEKKDVPDTGNADTEKIEMGFSIPDTETTSESDKKRVEVMDEKLEEGTKEKPSQEDGGKAE